MADWMRYCGTGHVENDVRHSQAEVSLFDIYLLG